MVGSDRIRRRADRAAGHHARTGTRGDDALQAAGPIRRRVSLAEGEQAAGQHGLSDRLGRLHPVVFLQHFQPVHHRPRSDVYAAGRRRPVRRVGQDQQRQGRSSQRRDSFSIRRRGRDVGPQSRRLPRKGRGRSRPEGSVPRRVRSDFRSHPLNAPWAVTRCPVLPKSAGHLSFPHPLLFCASGDFVGVAENHRNSKETSFMKRSNSSRLWTAALAVALAAALAMLGAACAPSASSPAPGQAQSPGAAEATVEKPEAGEDTPDSPEVEPEIEFFGAIESIGADAWTIDGQTVRLTEQTRIKDAAELHDRVRVHARVMADGALVAREIERASDDMPGRQGAQIEFTGAVEAMDAAAWTVDGQSVAITAHTEIEDGIKGGDFVEVHAQVEADGSLVAREIRPDESGSGDVENDNDDNGNANGNGDDNQNGNNNDNGNDANENDDDNQNGNDNGNDNGGDDNGNGDNGNDNDDGGGNDNGDDDNENGNDNS